MCWLPVLSVSAGCFDFSKRNKSPVIDKHYINGRLFCITRIYKPQKQNAHFGKNKMPPKCDKLSSILTFQTAFKFL